MIFNGRGLYKTPRAAISYINLVEEVDHRRLVSQTNLVFLYFAWSPVNIKGLGEVWP